MPREGLLIRQPLERLKAEEIELIHGASLKILENPGINCYNAEAAEVFGAAGASVKTAGGPDNKCWELRLNKGIIEQTLNKAPDQIVLGARNIDNQLVLKGDESRVHLVSGSETNVWLDASFETYVNKNNPSDEVDLPVFTHRRGTVNDLVQAAHLANHLETLDGFIRPVNIQDKDINNDNKDVNKFFACLNNTTKHVMAGLTTLEQLESVLKMAEIIAGGPDELAQNPIISFITCLVKSPLVMVNDTTQTLIELSRRNLPVVVSSSPQAGTTAPPTEAGIVAQINAEVLAGIALSQLVNPGTPVIYGCVPVRARLDNLNDAYGAPESAFYNIDCAQMARFYRLPCYSTAGVSDAPIPGMQSAVERLFSSILVAMSGPQYLHCAFGLLDGNSTFSPLQAVIDNAHFKMLKIFVQDVEISRQSLDEAINHIEKTTSTSQKLFINYIRPLMRKGKLSRPYVFEDSQGRDRVMLKANQKLQEIMERPAENLPAHTITRIFDAVQGIVKRLDTR